MDSLFARHSDSPVSAYLFVRNLLSRLDYASVKAYRDRLTKPMPLLKKRSLVNRIVDFIRKHAEKYQ